MSILYLFYKSNTISIKMPMGLIFGSRKANSKSKQKYSHENWGNQV